MTKPIHCLYVGGYRSKPTSTKAKGYKDQINATGGSYVYVWQKGKQLAAWYDEVKEAVSLLPSGGLIVAQSLGAWAVLRALWELDRTEAELVLINPLANASAVEFGWSDWRLKYICRTMLKAGFKDYPLAAMPTTLVISKNDELIPRGLHSELEQQEHINVLEIDDSHNLDNTQLNILRK